LSAHPSHGDASGLITLDFQFNQPGCYETSSDFFSLLSNNVLLLGACLLPIITVMPLMMLTAFLRASKAEQIGTLNNADAFFSSVRMGSLRRKSSEALASVAAQKFHSASFSKVHSSKPEPAGKAASAILATQEALIELCGAGETLQSSAPNDQPKVQIVPLSPSQPTAAHGGGLTGSKMLAHSGGLKVTIPGNPVLPTAPTKRPLPLTAKHLDHAPNHDPKLHRKLQRGMTFAMPKKLEHSADEAARFHYW
jgi:hypothetical protein